MKNGGIKTASVIAYPEWPLELGVPANVRQKTPNKKFQDKKADAKVSTTSSITSDSQTSGNQETNEANTKKWLFADTSCYEKFENEQLVSTIRRQWIVSLDYL